MEILKTFDVLNIFMKYLRIQNYLKKILNLKIFFETSINMLFLTI